MRALTEERCSPSQISYEASRTLVKTAVGRAWAQTYLPRPGALISVNPSIRSWVLAGQDSCADDTFDRAWGSVPATFTPGAF
jgi:hypothetical protein